MRIIIIFLFRKKWPILAKTASITIFILCKFSKRMVYGVWRVTEQFCFHLPFITQAYMNPYEQWVCMRACVCFVHMLVCWLLVPIEIVDFSKFGCPVNWKNTIQLTAKVAHCTYAERSCVAQFSFYAYFCYFSFFLGGLFSLNYRWHKFHE